MNKDLKLRQGKATWLCREHVKERKYKTKALKQEPATSVGGIAKRSVWL